MKKDLLARAEYASRDGKAVLKSTSDGLPTVHSSRALLSWLRLRRWLPSALSGEAATSFADQMAARVVKLRLSVTDIHDVRARIVAELTDQQAPGIPASMSRSSWPLLTWHRLTPATLDPEKVIALITSDGGPQAHTAILASRSGLPAIVAAKGVTEIADGTVVYVDSNEGIVDTELPPTLTVRQHSNANRKPVADFDGQGAGLTAPALSCTQTLVTASPLRRLQA